MERQLFRSSINHHHVWASRSILLLKTLRYDERKILVRIISLRFKLSSISFHIYCKFDMDFARMYFQPIMYSKRKTTNFILNLSLFGDFNGNQTKILTYNVSLTASDYYGGRAWTYTGNLSYSLNKHLSIRANTELNFLKFPGEYSDKLDIRYNTTLISTSLIEK